MALHPTLHLVGTLFFLQTLGSVWSAGVHGWGAARFLLWDPESSLSGDWGGVSPACCPLVPCFVWVRTSRGPSMPSIKRAGSGCLTATPTLTAGDRSPQVMCLRSLKALSSGLVLSGSVIIMDQAPKCFVNIRGTEALGVSDSYLWRIGMK